MLNHLSRYGFDLAVLALVTLIQFAGARMLLRWSPQRRWTILLGLAASMFAMLAGFALRSGRLSQHFDPEVATRIRALSMSWALFSPLLVLTLALVRWLPRARPEFSPARRRALRTMRALAVAAPSAAFGYGIFIERSSVRLHEQEIAIPGLAPDLDGLRIVQLSDIHLSPLLSESVLERAVAIANETRANLALVTGDLISMRGDPLDACLDRLKQLRADAGVFGCMGNHEIYADVEDYVTEQGARFGMRFLRGVSEPLRFGNATLNLAGVDYQPMHTLYLAGAERMIQPDALNVLLSHNPDVFPEAARQGWQFTIAGHTHGGQVNIEILRRDWNIARFYTPYTIGLYREGAASVYVSRGIGTIGMPLRLGSTPEVALLKLCRT